MSGFDPPRPHEPADLKAGLLVELSVGALEFDRRDRERSVCQI